MVSQVDVKFRIDDELEAILHLTKRLEADVKRDVANRKEQRKLMKALLRVEKGVHEARKKLGE